jgi:hypothetical protein
MKAKAAALALLPAILVLQACGGSESDLEKSLRKGIGNQSTADVQFVACPKNVTTGQTFKCKAVIPVDVTQLDQNGNLRWQITNLSGKPPGATGPSFGASGLTGPTGVTGVTGASGPTFPVGVSGATSAGSAEGKLTFVTLRNKAQGYSIRYPKGWAKADNGTVVTLNSPIQGRYAAINATKDPFKLTTAGLQKELNASVGLIKKGKFTQTTVAGNVAFTVTYERRSGKLRLLIRRYVFWRKKKRVTLDIGSPVASATVPNFTRNVAKIANSFSWL